MDSTKLFTTPHLKIKALLYTLLLALVPIFEVTVNLVAFKMSLFMFDHLFLSTIGLKDLK